MGFGLGEASCSIRALIAASDFGGLFPPVWASSPKPADAKTIKTTAMQRIAAKAATASNILQSENCMLKYLPMC
jgi:hypothetical protein